VGSRQLPNLVGVMALKRRRRGDDRGTWIGDLLGASVDVAHGASEVWIFMFSCVGWIGEADFHVFMFYVFLGIYFLGIYLLGISFLGNFFLRAYTALIPLAFLSF